ncbi:MAG: Na+:solute symporter [Chitinophagales bacterium]|nr:Na+:solute symporter [Chitinophagales bacterium]
MQLANLDWGIILLYFIVTLILGVVVTRKSGKNSEEFFLGSRQMPWWLLGISMVATTFSADTPNLVTDIVRNNGVAGNWAWWAFLLTGMLTVFVYAKLWRRSEITTDLEFYELRYSGREASFLRGFRAIYLGVFFNVVIMATVMLAGIKIAGILLGLSAIKTIVIVSIITVIYSAIGGYKGVLYTDFFQFILAMIGMVWAAIYIVNMPEIGGLDQLLSHPNVQSKMSFLPRMDDMSTVVPLLIIPLAVQWWSVWYPGAEPGGGGYIAQRMLSAKDEKNAVIATLLFNVAHYALRPWPWILIAFASIVIFPNASDIAARFPAIDASFVKDDLGFPAMLSYLPAGLMGLVIAALIAALMSTISTHLNWGSSYIVNDVYQRFY